MKPKRWSLNTSTQKFKFYSGLPANFHSKKAQENIAFFFCMSQLNRGTIHNKKIGLCGTIDEKKFNPFAITDLFQAVGCNRCLF
jgi:hypothetical protein